MEYDCYLPFSLESWLPAEMLYWYHPHSIPPEKFYIIRTLLYIECILKIQGLRPFMYNSITLSLYIPCSLLYIPCSLIYLHGSLLYIPCFPRKKRICKIIYNLGIRTHDLMQTARPRWPLHHERWYKTVFVHGISMFDSALRGVRHLAAGVGHPARGPPRRPLRPWRHRHGPSSSLRFPGLLTQKSWHSGSRACCRPLDSNLKLELPSVLAARPSAMRTAGTSLLKPDSTPLQNKIKLSASLWAGSSILKNLCY